MSGLSDVHLTPVVSEAVDAVGYDYETRTLRVVFTSGKTYDYYDVPAHLYEVMLLPHPWRRVGQQIRAHAYREVAA
ncbi:KTSC domain-containing protein [Kribbella sp. NPDC005582]|uniref:KTSC domain-containing protein n=1 Tax=Kribbella sp. NPDC005582 TaxID=3156893 RepID=UPI0033BE9D4A